MDDENSRGAICALGTLWAIERNTVVYDEVVRALGPDDLIKQARKDGNMRWSGLSDYLKRERARARIYSVSKRRGKHGR